MTRRGPGGASIPARAPLAQKLVANVGALAGVESQVGWFETAKYPNGMPVAYVAAIHEFGHAAGGIPPRPFFRPTIAAQTGEWSRQFGRAATAVANGKIEPEAAMTQLAGFAGGDVAKTIATLTTPALKEATVNARRNRRADKKTTGGLTKPLVDTGIMLGTLSFAVSGQGGRVITPVKESKS